MLSYSFTASPEKQIVIPIEGSSLHINGILRGTWDQPLVVLVHGLACDNRGLLPFLLSKLLHQHGFATLRVNMYDRTDNTRDMVDCTMETHVEDFGRIVAYARMQHSPRVFAVGHSYGGLTILSSNTELDGAVLLEPSHFKCSMELDELLKSKRKETTQKIVAYENGAGYIDPLPMVYERKAKATLAEETLAQKAYPLLFVAAENCSLLPYIQKYHQVANQPKKLYIAEGASHDLTDTDEIMLNVFQQTLTWLSELCAPKIGSLADQT